MKHYKERVRLINTLIEKHILNPIQNSHLREIVEYSLIDGKRLRSILALIIGENTDSHKNIEKLVVCVELLHNASLIIDDMPCMDNDIYRRGKETVHYKYGQQKAQMLVNYFIKKAFQLLNENYHEIYNYIKENAEENQRETSHNKNKQLTDYSKTFLELNDNIIGNLGFMGAASGQFIDTCPMNKLLNEDSYKQYYSSIDDILNLLHLKTTTFFEIGFIPAYLICNGNKENIPKLKEAVKYFGLAFQISDDFEDIEQDKNRLLGNYNPNLICKYGKKESMKIYKQSITKFNCLMNELNITHVIIGEIINFLNNRVNTLIPP